MTENYDKWAKIEENGTLWVVDSKLPKNVDNCTLTEEKFQQIGTDTDWSTVHCGYGHLAIFKTDGTLWTMGFNQYGQLGIGTTEHISYPVQVEGGYDWAIVCSGRSFTVGLKFDGTLWAWGLNNLGQLGLGDTEVRVQPTQIGTCSDWKHVSCGFSHVLGMKKDGSLWTWGHNNHGQLGLGEYLKPHEFVSVPTQVGSDVDWTYTTCGPTFILVNKADGCWVSGSIPPHLLRDTAEKGISVGLLTKI